MILGPVFERFINESPLSVMARATIEYALPGSFLDALFERTAETGYTKDLLFSTTVDLMSLVAVGRVPHVQSAFQRIRDRVPVTLKCVYEKLQHIETKVSAEMVRSVASRCEGLITELGGACECWRGVRHKCYVAERKDGFMGHALQSGMDLDQAARRFFEGVVHLVERGPCQLDY